MTPVPIMTAAQDVERHLATLLAQGFCIVPDALPAPTIEALTVDLAEPFDRTPFGTGGFYGETTRRFGRLLIRSSCSRSLVSNPLILAIVEAVLLRRADCVQLNTTQAIAVHPGAPAQLPHRDQDMWPAPKGDVEYLVNVMWPLDPFTPQNGATRLWPRSHGRAALDQTPPGEPVTPTVEPGSALLFLGSTLHAAGANHTQAARRGIVVGYSLGWLKSYENQFLAYPPAIASGFSRELADLVGYRQHRPNLGNYEGQCPSVLLEPDADPDAPRGAVDALRPDQAALIDTMLSGAPLAGQEVPDGATRASAGEAG